MAPSPDRRQADLERGEELAGPIEAPVSRGERLHTLDVLRGFALLGILVVNVEDFAGPESSYNVPVGLAHPAFVGWHAHLDLAILLLKWVFVEGKMRGLFAMLFGAGAVLLTERIERRGQPAREADIFLRRNMWLALFGLIHGTLIWWGDILLAYGLVALLFLYPLRHVGGRTLVGVGLAVWLVAGTFGTLNVIGAVPRIRAGHQLAAATHLQQAGQRLTPAQTALLAAAAKAEKAEPAAIAESVREGREGYLQSIPGRTAFYLLYKGTLFTSGYFTEVLGSMILGMGLYKLGFLSGRWSARSYLITAAAGYALSIPIVLTGLSHARQLGFTKAAVDEWLMVPYCFEAAPGALANAAIVLLLSRGRWLKPAFAGLGAVGRTAFSNYILTSLLCQFVFAWGPWKLYGVLEYYQYLYVVAVVWTLNLIASVLWLKAFAFGPLEWVWRSLTYWKVQPFRLRQPRFA